MTPSTDGARKLLYTTAEAAQLLSLDAATVRRLCESGHIKAVKLDGRYRISYTALDAFVLSLTEGA